jgi:thiol-disulfide isomerase/thioredoxin
MIKPFIIGMLFLLFPTRDEGRPTSLQRDLTEDYLITGKVDNYDGWIYLGHGDKIKKDINIDSSKVINGEFRFSGKVSGIEAFILGIANRDVKGRILPSKAFIGPFLLSSGHLKFQGDFDWKTPLTAFGTEAQDEYNSFKKKIDPVKNELNKIVQDKYSTKKSDWKKLDSLNTKYPMIINKIREVVKAHVSQFPNSQVSAYIAQSELKNADPDLLKLLYDQLTTAVQQSVYGIALLQLQQAIEPTAVGRISPPFSVPNASGQLFSLANSKGTYTLIDFWASWCAPCRREHPNLVKAFNSYKLKGFKIISISMDTDKASWIKAVAEDKLPWLQLSDLKGLQSETGKNYGIKMLPMNFLIDMNGKIIARDLKGVQLIKKLEEMR